MTRVVRNAALLCVAGILVASAALANVPDPARSSVGNGRLAVEGTTTDAEAATDACSDGFCGDLLVTVRDFANNVIAGSLVVVDFANCSDINISCNQSPGTTATGQTYLSNKKVQGTTNALGQFNFRVQGAGPVNASCAGTPCAGTNAGVACATVYADGVPIGNLKVSAYDINRAGSGQAGGALAAGDVAIVQGDVLTAGAGPRARDDYDANGGYSANDVSLSKAYVLTAANPPATGSFNTMHSGWAGTFCP